MRICTGWPLCDLTLVARIAGTQRIHETHNLIGHILCELVERMLFEQAQD